MDGIAARLAAAWPKSNSDSGVRVISLLDQVTGHVRLALSLLLAAVALVLLMWTVELHSPGQNDPLNPPRFHGLVEALEALPGVEAAGGISRYFQANVMQNGVTIPGAPPLDPSHSAQVNYDVIGGDYLQALGIPLLRGRYFSRKDGPDATKVVIVNDAFVRAFLPDQDPVGVSFHRTGDPTAYTIVGVVGDTRRQDITTQPIPEVLWPHAQRPWGMNLAIRTTGAPLSLVNAVRNTIHRFDRNVVIAGVTTMDRRMDERIALRRFQTRLLGIFAAMALVLAMIGIYGLMHYSVTERRQEIGVRIALGAQSREVVAMVLKDATSLAFMGMAIGLAAALWATRLLAGLLYGVSAHDPLTYGGAFVLLAAAALCASVFPARRAAGCDPLLALRQE